MLPVFSISCDDPIEPNHDVVFPEENVSYINHVYPFLKNNCAYAGCHSTAYQEAGVVLDTYHDLFRRPGLIVLDNPEGSELIQILEVRIPHERPYFYKGYFIENEINGMKTWIIEGALNN